MSQTRSPRLACSRLALVLLVLVLPARTTLAASRDLDPTFGAGGIVITDITDNSSETACRRFFLIEPPINYAFRVRF